MLEVTQKEQYDLERKAKELAKAKRERIETLKRYTKLVIVLGVVIVGGIFLWKYVATRLPEPQESIILANNGLHWHAQLSIKILGENQEIPAGMGLGVAENPIHTHDKDGIIHMEFTGRVLEGDLRLGKFFKIWGKTFNKDCIFDKCLGPEGSLKMLVSGKENLEFENYIMQDGDRIEIIFGK